jgi:signal transduction histidine kinase
MRESWERFEVGEAMITESPTPEFAEVWSSEIHLLVIRIFRARLAVMVLVVIAFVVFMAFEPVPWKLWWIGVTALLTAILSLHEYFRIKRTPPSLTTLQLNLSALLLLQSSMIFITGGIESPLIPIYVPFGLIAGLSLRIPWRVACVAAIPFVCTALFAAGAFEHWFPRTTPAFFGLGEGFSDKAAYVWTKAGVLMLLVSTTSVVGALMRLSYERITRQVAERKHEMLDALASRNREILSVGSTVAHELKNPLTSIQGLAQLMARTSQGKDGERLEVMRREIARMANVLDEFRNFSRPLSGLSLTRTRMRRLIDDVVQLNEGRADGRGVRLTLDPGDDVVLVCDPQKIKQALQNLVQNALEATASGGKVEVQLKIVDVETAFITVIDNGPGLCPEIADRLFTPGVTTKEHGTGVGLVVARSIAQQHGGKVEIENLPIGGCAASMRLPIKAALASEQQV